MLQKQWKDLLFLSSWGHLSGDFPPAAWFASAAKSLQQPPSMVPALCPLALKNMAEEVRNWYHVIRGLPELHDRWEREDDPLSWTVASMKAVVTHLDAWVNLWNGNLEAATLISEETLAEPDADVHPQLAAGAFGACIPKPRPP